MNSEDKKIVYTDARMHLTYKKLIHIRGIR